MRTLYFDCFAGASGNMILAALVAAGIDATAIQAELSKLSIPNFELIFESVDRAGIASLHLTVEVADQKDNRHLNDIEAIIKDSELSQTIKARAIAIFRRLAQAEAKVHGTSVELVHFHEVGGLDAIIDIVGACIGFELLGIERFACSKIHVGSGFVTMDHGKFPVPPPAVAELLIGKPIYSTDIEGELITPTGAAIISTVCDNYGPIPELIVEETAYGAGTREYENFPNVLRIMIGDSNPVKSSKSNENIDSLEMLETNIDDSTPQVMAFVMERALQIGALDCWVTPIQMKKNRPAFQLSILCETGHSECLKAMIFAETSTIGIRQIAIERESLIREFKLVKTVFGQINVKFAYRDGKLLNAMPEYEDVRRVALENGIPFITVTEAVARTLSDGSMVFGQS